MVYPMRIENAHLLQSITLGEYRLRAEIDGAVLGDSFEQGQRIDVGEPLISLADESELWVEAHLPR